ncbi:nebulin isoform 38-T39 [Liasis olivaceus]
MADEDDYDEVVEYYVEEEVDDDEPGETITEITETTYKTGSAPYTVTTRHTSGTGRHPSETRIHTYETIEHPPETRIHTYETTRHPSETRIHTYEITEHPPETTRTFETTTTRTLESTAQPPEAKDIPHKASHPVRKKVVRKKVDTSKFRTPYLDHSSKMQKLFSDKKYKEKFEKEKGKPCAITTDTPELRRIKKVQDQLSEVKYRMAGESARTDCHLDEKARDIEHAKKVSQQVSKVLYKQNWEENKEKYLLPPDAPELVHAIKNTALYSRKPYVEEWEADKALFYPYDDSPELRRVAKAQKALSDIVYKKGHDEQKSKYTVLPDPPDVELAKKVTRQLSDHKYHEDYQKKKGKWSQTPGYDVAIARMNADNLSARKYQEDWEAKKDQIHFTQTETPEYEVNKRAGIAASKVKYKEDYEKSKGSADYNVLPATENPLLRHLKAAGNLVNDKLYKEAYEKAKAKSINYCETPKYQVDNVLKNFSDVKYKEPYITNVLGRYIGSSEDPYQAHCMKVEAMKSDKNYKADYEDEKASCYFPQTITQEYEVLKKLDKCKDHAYKKHPDQIKFTPVMDSPVLVQAQVNTKQLSDMNYKAKHEAEKSRCSIPPDAPLFLQSRVNAYNISDNWYKYDWDQSKAKKFDIKMDAIPILAAKAKQKIASDVEYKKGYEKGKGKLIGALCVEDDPKILHSLKVGKLQNDRLYKEGYEKGKGLSINYCETPQYQVDNALKNFSGVKYKEPYVANVLGRYIGSIEDPYQVHCMKVEALKSDKNYKADYEDEKAKCYFPQTITPEYEVMKKLDTCKDFAYKKHPDQIKFTSVLDSPVLLQAQINTKQLSDMNYKAKHEAEKSRCSIPPDAPLFLQSRVNAYNISDNWYKYDWDQSKAKKFDIKMDAIPILAAKAKQKIASDVEYKKGYEKGKGKLIGALCVEDDPKILHSLKVGKLQNDRLYKEGFEKAKGVSINYCETPQYQVDSTLKNFSGVKYKEPYVANVLGRYIGSIEDPYQVHCMKVEALKSDKNYKADYEDEKAKCYFPQTITPEYEVMKKLDTCKDFVYKKHPDQIKFTPVLDSPVLLQAQINTKQLSDMNYKAKHEAEKSRCSIPPDAPLFLQSRVNAYNISDNWYKYDWDQSKAKKFDIKMDAIPILAAKAKQKIASDVEYKKGYEKGKGKLIGALCVEDDPKILHSLKVGKLQNDRLYKEGFEKAKGVSINYCETPQYQVDSTLKNFSGVKYKEPYVANVLGRYIGSIEDPYQVHCMKVEALKSDKNYKADYEDEKAKCYFPQTITQEYEAIKKLDTCKDHAYKKHPDQIKFTPVTDSMVMVRAQMNSKQLSDLNYKAKHEAEKGRCSVPPDAPLFLQSRVNAYNVSDVWYKYDWDQSKAKKFDIKVDAIPILAAKAKQKIASDVEYKKGYEQSKGKLIGALSIEDDPKMIHCQKVAKQQSDLEYKKGYEVAKTRYTAPLDMIPVVQAKKAQAIISDTDYRHRIHDYSYPPDSINVELARKANALQSDTEYKADYNSYMKGCGWVPYGSLDAVTAKKASEYISEKKYRQHPDTLKFTQIEDHPTVVQAKINQAQRSDVLYKAKNEEIIHNYNLPADAPQFVQAKVNSYNVSDVYYKLGLEDLKLRGYDLRSDAIPIRAAKAARQAASDFEYKKDYEQARGKLIGFQSVQDDPKLVHYINVAKMQSERDYKKAYEQSKTRYNTPLDMVNVVAAKKAQEIASNTNYKNLLHHYTLLPDDMNVERSKNMMQIQSDNLYKADFNSWMKGIGWIPIGSLDAEKARKAGEALNEKKYRQHPDTIKFTSIVDSPVMVQAKQNALQLSDRLYKSSGEEMKHTYNLPADAPQFIQAKYNAANLSDIYYKYGYHDLIAKGHSVLADAIPITLAKASRNIASDFKYKEAYRKTKGKQVGFRSLQDDPMLVHSMNVAKMQSEREYKKDYEKSKTCYHTPVEMVSIQAAKQAQDVASNVNYKHLLHHYTYLPDAMNVELAKNRMQIQSDIAYKDDYNNWFRGVGWSPLGSMDMEKVRKAGEALNESKYRQHPDTFKFTSLMDSMPMVLAHRNTKQLSDINYKVEGEKLKHTYHLDPDVPEFLQAKVNAYNISDNIYKADWKKRLAKGYDLKADAIPIVAAKATRNIASDYKYKESYEKDKGKQVGFLSLQDDPKLVHYMNVAKLQSEREYKKGYESSKTKYNLPLDLFSVVAAKKAQEVVTDTNYRQPLHSYTLLPDAMSMELSRNRMQIQSDNLYKTDFNSWLKGLGWVPIQSLEVENAKNATHILSEKKYRHHPDRLKYTIDMDAMEQVLAKQNAHLMNKRLYVEKWNKDKTDIHVMPDTPEILLSKANQITMSDKLYRSGWEEEKKKGYDLRSDALSIRAAKASRDIASDYKYKLAFEQSKGKQIGFLSLEDDPKLVHYMEVAKMQSEREYKKDYEKSKTRFQTPVDMLSVVAAKKAQEVATDTNYRNIIHTYSALPDSMNLELAKNMMQIQSDNQYKADYAEFMKGIGWVPLGSLEAEKNKKAMEIVSEKKYRQHPDKLKYSILMDSMPMVLATNNAKIMDEHLYKKDWEAEKTQIHITPDMPEILLAKVNAYNISDKIYKHSLEEAKRRGCDVRADAIPIQAAKASREIASDYKYKLGYEQDKGKLVGFRSLQDDPKLVHYIQVAKMQSAREYKKDYESSKTLYNTPADTVSIVAAKEAQANITNTNYKRLIHNYILLPDAMNVELARNMNRVQSALEYKQDYNEWYKGLGWSPAGSLDIEKSKKATEIASDTKYRQHPSAFPFTKLSDSMDMELAKHNADLMNKRAYIDAWEKDKTTIHVMPDTPDIMLAKANRYNYSQKVYKLGLEEMLKKGYDLTTEALSVKAAKASRDIASDYKYKEGYRKQLGHHIGARSVEDDPKLVHSMNVAKMQSEREYKKDFEKWKTKYSSPVDMWSILGAKNCQKLVSDIDYRNYLHQWTCLPDQNDVIQAKKVYELQSDNAYKSDLEWLKGIGWNPYGSLESEKNKKASEILSERNYRQHPDTIKFTSIPDSMEVVLAKENSKHRSDRLYREAWDKDKTQIHIMPDTPEIVLSRINLINLSDKLYKLGLEELIKQGYELPLDAIPIKAAKASREIASEYKYKEAYRKQLGHHVGARSIEDDPKLVHCMNVAKMQSEREYKKVFEKLKTKYSSPVDMWSILGAKNCQKLVSDIDYRNYLHEWTCLPDQNDVIHAKKTYDLQSDNIYKSDLEWLRGIGWSPAGSLEAEKNRRAAQILSDHQYRQHPDTLAFTSPLDSMPMTLAKHNSELMNQRMYVDAWNKDKTSIHIMPDTPEILLSQQNKINYSDKLYKMSLEEARKRGYDLRVDAIPIKAAKASRDIASEYKYKEGYRKQLGHHVGARCVEDDPKIVHSMNVAKMQSEREYKKVFEQLKTKYSSPVDMLSILGAKNCQKLVTDIDYRNYLHQWTCLPDQNDVIHARKAYELQSDNSYKSDLQWLRGIGWVPIGSVENEKVKKAGEILSEKLYRQPPETFKFTSVPDSLEIVLAKHNAENMNKRLYTEAWNNDKTQVHIMPDTPEITLARQNKINYSENLYKLSLEEARKRGYDLRIDAIPIQSAKASRIIASDYKYKEGYRRQLGHHIGARCVEDDPKIVHCMNVAKMQSEREYKKVFEKLKTKYSSPVDMWSILGAKNCQKLVSDIDYRNYLHEWTCLPDQNDVIHAKKAYDLQSDNYYKSDLEWMKGIGWVPIGSLNVEHVKKAGEILSEKMYRQPPESLSFTSVTDSLPMELARHNAEIMNKRLYTEAWDKDKCTIHVMPDTPEIVLAKLNKFNYSQKLYRLAMEQAKKDGYDLRLDAIPIQAAKASRIIASDYIYKEGYRKQLGHHIGAHCVEDDPKIMHCMNVAKMQSEREYKKVFEKLKTKYSSPVDMWSILGAKNCQKLVSDIDYRNYLHEWTCLPDQNDVIQARKAYDLQSDALYKSDLEWLKGIGWVPLGSLNVEHVKRAGDILSEKKYRQPRDEMKFTCITDTWDVELAKHNAEMMSKQLYTEAWDADKTNIHVMPDTPEILLAKANSANISHKLYVQGWEEAKKKGYDLRIDAIPIRMAKASRDIASDYKYKEAHEKQKGHYVGLQRFQDDPKLVWFAHAGMILSDLEYKKNFEKWKAKIHSPVDMLSILGAKNCQKLVSEVDYRTHLHEWTCLPDQNDVIQAKKAYELQSDNVYKSDLEWLRGIGWMPEGSLEVQRVKNAQDLMNERLYRQPRDYLKFTAIVDTPDIVLAKANALMQSGALYHEVWDKEKTQFTLPADTPEMLLSKANAINYSKKHYQLGWEEVKKKGHDLRLDAIEIQHAKASRDIASEYKYKEGYRKQVGHHVGFRNIHDDPKLVLAMRVAKLQSEREYKKYFEKSKTKFSSPVDMLSILLAKKCQKLVSDIDYRHPLHEWICLPDQNDVIQAKKAYDLQSDNLYKSDLEWLRGIGWMPEGSLDVLRVKRAQDLVNERLYKLRPDELKFTSIADPPPVLQAKINAQQISENLYREAWDKEKAQIHLPLDTPIMLQSKINAVNISNKHYTGAWDEDKAKGYDFKVDALSFKHAKSSREIASEYKYKETYERQKGHYIGCPSVKADPKLSWAARVMKMQNDRLYKQAYHKSKAMITIPGDMVAIQAAKQGQALASDIDYHHYLHEWTCLPDQNDVIQAKKAYELQSDNLYKSDLEWLRGIGWMPEGSVDVLRVKRAQDLVNERLYKLRPDELKFTSIVDTPPVIQAKINAQQISENLYRELWDKEKAQIHLPLDTPIMLQSKINAVNVSNKHYTGAWDETKANDYDFKVDALSFKHAKSSREIASEYKYKETYERQKGHYIGCPSVKADPKLSWAARVMKMQNDRLYKQAYHKSKAMITIPGDMVAIQAAKQGQALASDIDYHHYLHEWTCLPDQNDVIQAKKAYELQSDAVYKSDLEWLRGIGWMPSGSPIVKRVKHAQEILSDNVYRTPADRLKFTNITDTPDILLAKTNSEQISIPKYREVWDKDKVMIHVMPDTPEIILSRANAINVSKKLYRDAWDDVKKYIDYRSDAIPIKRAKASREIASDYKYKEGYRKQVGHHVGFRNIHDDPKLVLAMRVAKLQSEREYKKYFEKSKTKFSSPVDMLSILLAKKCQKLVSDIDYRHPLHEWICLPDQNDVIQAKKAYNLQSDAIYKSDLEWLRGIGWMPSGSVSVNHVKHAQELLNERLYRTKVDSLPFTPVADRVDYITAKQGGEILSDVKYHQEWNSIKDIYTLTETPRSLAAKEAARILNHYLYKDSWEKHKAIGYTLPPDSVPFRHAKHSDHVQSELKYKADYVIQRGHYVGVNNMREDPKLVWFEHAGKIQNDRLYKESYHKTKSHVHIPPDIRSVIAARDCQHLVSEIPYRHYLHEWTCHPDQNDCIQAKKAYDLQSDNLYKSDLEWLRGCGWIPLDSVDHRRVKKAQDLVNKRIYTKEAIDNFDNFTSIEDTPDVVLAKTNSIIQSDLKYKETFNLQKGHYIGSDDTPALNLSRRMAKLYSDIVYKDAWESGKAIGYTLPPDYIPIVGAKHADYVNSLLKYKAMYEKLKGHYLAGKHIDFPSVLHSLAFQKMRSALAYRKNYEDTKAHIHIPSDMMHHVLAKKCQYILSDLEYRTYLHQWNCSPEENDVVVAKKAQEILSDVIYKDDLTWLRGIGCYVWDTPQILQAKKSYDLQSQLLYTKEGKDNLQNYGVVTDTPVYVTAVKSGINASDLKYKEQYHKIKDKYTTVLKTVDHERIQKLKHLFSNNLYKKLWDKIKSITFKLPPDAVPFVRARQLKYNASIVKYREEYDKFKALYTLPKGVQDDPNTARCLRVGKLNIDRLYREVYEKNKAKIHIAPDMVGIVSAKNSQKKISEVDYRVHLHEWASIPDPHANILARKVNNQLSDFVYRDDLNWLKGIGCFVWDTPEILRAKHAYDLRNLLKYKAEAEKMKSKYSVVTDTPLYVQNVISGKNLSEAVYRHNYVHNIKGKYTPTEKTVDLERANRAYKIQSEPLYRNAGLHALPTGYKLPPDTPGFKLAKHAQYIGSDIKYKEIYEHIKGTGYNFGPKAVPFVHTRKVNKILNERLYREIYHKNKDKIHTTPDTPHIRQVKINQEAFSDLIYKTDFFRMQGHLISLPFTPQTVHNRYVGEITSDIKYKSDLEWLRGLGCFLYDTPDMVRARHLRKLWSHYVYTDAAKKIRDKYSLVLDTPGYRKIQELKTHLSEIVYRAVGREQKTKYTSILDTPDYNRAKRGQKLQSQYLYVELATKERPHHHAGDQTPALKLAKHVKDFASEKKYRALYDKLKDKYVTVADTPILIRAKKAYLNASDLRYKETFERAKGKYHTVKDALDIVYHRKVTDDVSKVKYKEKYMSELGFWRSIPDRPEHYHYRAVTDAVSSVKYKEDLTWLRGIGCYVWDTPDFVLAEKNKALYSPYKYKETFEKIKSKFKYVADSPINRHVKYATQLMNEKLYKSEYEKKKDKYSFVVDDPKTLLAKWGGELSSQYKYKRLYEKQKDKYTTIVDTPEHLRTTKVNKLISDILYKLEYKKAIPKGYTTIHDTPMILHVRKVMDRISELKYKELYQQNKSHCNVVPDSVHIKAAKQAYKVNSNLDYKKKYEATKAHWHWTTERPDFIQAAKTSLQQSDYEYKLDREYLRGCKLSVTDDKNTVLALQSAILASDLKYKEKHNKERGSILPVPDTPQILLAKMVSSLVSENKYKEHVKKLLPHGSFTKLPETRDTVHVKKVTKNVSETNYKKNFQKEKGKSDYSIMLEPPDVKHAMEVAKKQSTIEYKKDARSQLHYTTVADRPDIMKATQVSHLVSDIEYKAKGRGEAGVGVTMLGRPDIELAKEVSKLTSQVKYKERFDKEKGKRPQYDLKESKIYKTLKDAHHIASEVKYKADLKKLHKPVTDMSESLAMHHVLNTSHLASTYQYKKKYEKSKGHYHVVPDNLEQIHLKEASELQSIVKYKEKYEKERGKPMLDFETPTYITAKEAQHMQSEKEYKKDFEEQIKGRNLTGLEITPSLLHVKYATRIASEKEYRRDLEEGVRGKGLTILEETPDLLRAKNATYILNEKEYKKALEMEIKGRGLTDLALETPDYMRAKNATDIASGIKYKHSAEMEKANYTTVVDTPEIIHAHHVKNLSSKKKYKEDAERTMPYYVPVLETPEIQRVRENQKNFSMLQYQHDLQDSKGKVTVVNETPEILRVKENQKNFSSVLYKDGIGTGTAIEKTPETQRIRRTTDAISTIKYKELIGKGTPIADLPEVKRVKETQQHISTVLYKENAGQGTAVPITPEIERVRRNQEHISSVSYKEQVGTGMATPVTPEMERVRRNQEHISSVLYKENLGSGTPITITPELERVKHNQEIFSSVLYKENLGTGTPTPVTPEMERVKHNQEIISSVLYKENVGKATPTSVTPEMERVKRNQEHVSSVLYKEDIGKGTPTPVTPEMERVKRNQEHVSSVLYKEDIGKGTPTPVTPEMERVKRNQEHVSSVLYKEDIGKGTPTPVTPEMERVKRNQEHVSSVVYKEDVGKGTPTPVTPEMERVKRNQEHISSVLYKEGLGKGTPTPVTPEMERVKRNQEHISSVVYKEDVGKGTPTPVTPEMERVRRNQEHISSVLYKEGLGKGTPIPITPEMERAKRNQEFISSVLYKENLGRATPTPVTPEMERAKRSQENISLVLYKESLGKGTPTSITPEMERAKRNQENISSILYSDSFRKQVQGKAPFVLDTPEMRRVRETQRHISTVKYHEDFEKTKGSFTPVVTDPITERVKKNTLDFSDINYRGIQRRVVQMEKKRIDHDQELNNLTGLRVWRTNPGSVFDYDPAEDNIQSRSLHLLAVQAQRRSREHSRSASALSLSGGDEKSEHSEAADQRLSYYSNGGFFPPTTTADYKHAKTVELPQQRSSSVVTQQTTVSSIPSHPSTAGKTYRAMYDYTAADADEVSFKDGDAIVNVQAIDEGWMYGTVQRTGKTGMLPANYVEAV